MAQFGDRNDSKIVFSVWDSLPLQYTLQYTFRLVFKESCILRAQSENSAILYRTLLKKFCDASIVYVWN